jgi:hypothetical protein
MYEITNKLRGPVQLVLRSRRGPSPKEFTVLNICGIGKGNNTYLVEDELMTDYIWQAEREKLVTVRYIEENSLKEGVK